MINVRTLLLLGLFFSSIALRAQTPPSEIKLDLIESIGDGCHTLSDPMNGLVCFDVVLEINEPDWSLLSYNIWMDYGSDSTVFSYASDSSCHHQDGGDISQINSFGKYRFLAANVELVLEANTPVTIQNFCLDVVDASRTNETPITPGGEHFDLLSSMNLVSPATGTAINPEITSGTPTIVDLVNAINEINNESLHISPNPFRQDLQIRTEDNIQFVEFFNLKGQSVLVANHINTNEIDLNLNSLQPGIYFAHVKTTTGLQVQKVMKL